MRFIRQIRYFTYAILIAIAVQLVQKSHVIPITLAQKNDYRGLMSAPPGESEFPPEHYREKSRPPLAILQTWVGLSDTWLKNRLGEPDLDSVLNQPITNLGASQGVQEILAAKHSNYSGAVKTWIWKKETRWYQAFFARPNDTWIVIDALSWEEGVKP